MKSGRNNEVNVKTPAKNKEKTKPPLGNYVLFYVFERKESGKKMKVNENMVI